MDKLLKMASRISSLQLKGPFHKTNQNELANTVTFEVPDLEILDFKSPINISIKIRKFYEEADSEIGFEGRNEIQEFIPIAINGMILENQEDKNTIHRAIYKYVINHEKKLVKAVS